jgi:hypothetical protein
MAKALGIGGLIFNAADPASHAAWYGRWLGREIGSDFNGAIFSAPRSRAVEPPADVYPAWLPFDPEDNRVDLWRPA